MNPSSGATRPAPTVAGAAAPQLAPQLATMPPLAGALRRWGACAAPALAARGQRHWGAVGRCACTA